MCLEAAGGRCSAARLLAELHKGLVVLLLLLLLLLVARQDEEEAKDAFQVAIPDLCMRKGGRRHLLSIGFVKLVHSIFAACRDLQLKPASTLNWTTELSNIYTLKWR